MPLELKEILATSRKNNLVFGISGALCFLDGIYMQWFEGEATAVNALYRKIENNPRHTDVKLLVRETIPLREYPKWSMALLAWNEETKEIFRAFNPGIGLNAYATDPASVTILLRTWSCTSNWMILQRLAMCFVQVAVFLRTSPCLWRDFDRATASCSGNSTGMRII